MHFKPIIRAIPAIALFVAAGAVNAAPPSGATGTSFQEERAACAQISAPDSRAACIREAGAARQAARAGQLTPGAAADYERNAEQRCTVFREPVDRDACIARVKNGPASGTVSGGGVLLEAETPVPVGGSAARPMAEPMPPAMNKPMPMMPQHGPKHGPDGKPGPKKPMHPQPMPEPKS